MAPIVVAIFVISAVLLIAASVLRASLHARQSIYQMKNSPKITEESRASFRKSERQITMLIVACLLVFALGIALHGIT